MRPWSRSSNRYRYVTSMLLTVSDEEYGCHINKTREGQRTLIKDLLY
jgi:hypothetical protein